MQGITENTKIVETVDHLRTWIDIYKLGGGRYVGAQGMSPIDAAAENRWLITQIDDRGSVLADTGAGMMVICEGIVGSVAVAIPNLAGPFRG